MGIQRYMSEDFAGAVSCFARAMEIDLEQVSGADHALSRLRLAACLVCVGSALVSKTNVFALCTSAATAGWI